MRKYTRIRGCSTKHDHTVAATLYSMWLLRGPGVIAAIITHGHHARAVWRAHCPAGYYSSGVAYYRASKLLNYSAHGLWGEQKQLSVLLRTSLSRPKRLKLKCDARAHHSVTAQASGAQTAGFSQRTMVGVAVLRADPHRCSVIVTSPIVHFTHRTQKSRASSDPSGGLLNTSIILW